MRKKVDGGITIFASLLFMVLVSFMTITIKSSILTTAKMKVQTITVAGVESLLSEYSRPLYDKYDILVFNSRYSQEHTLEISRMEQALQEYMKYNTDVTADKLIKEYDLYGMELISVDITDYIKITDEGGRYFAKEVTDYMQYGEISNVVADVIGVFVDSKNKEKINEANKEVEECQDASIKLNEKYMKLISLIEGISTKNGSFVIKNNHLKPEDRYAKMICAGVISRESLGINSEAVYSCMKDCCINPVYEIDLMIAELDGIKTYIGLKDLNGNLIVYDGTYRNIGANLYFDICKTEYAVNQALELISEIRSEEGEYRALLEQTRKNIEEDREELGDDTADGYRELLTSMEDTKSICDLQKLQEILENNKGVLDEMKLLEQTLYYKITPENIMQLRQNLEQCKEIIAEYETAGMQFDYSNIQFNSQGKISVLNEVKNFFQKGILYLVLDDKYEEMSERKIGINDLCSSNLLQQDIARDFSPQGIAEDLLYNEYVLSHFDTYMSEDAGKIIHYETEYILAGKKSDTENLKEVVTALVNLRFGFNFAYIIRDGEKKMAAYEMALSVLGFSGIDAVVRAGQYIILTAWSYAESIVDVRYLMAGEKVELNKSKNTWNTNIEDVMNKTINMNVENKKNKGLSYEDYLRILLFLKDRSSKYIRTMDVIELNMIHEGYENIRLVNYIYEISGNAVFGILRNQYTYCLPFQYSY